MSRVVERGESLTTVDPYEIGWYLESADEEIYGPASRQALRRFLEEGVIGLNTLVRHCTQPEARPVADQARIADPLELEGKGSDLGDRLEEAWPSKARDRRALAEGSVPCSRHGRPAVLVCVRCHAPFCGRCRAKPFRKQFFLCLKCQGGVYNRRFVALMIDALLIVYLPMAVAGFTLAAAGLFGKDDSTGPAILYAIDLACVCLLFVRDSAFGGAGPGKRIMGLRVVKSEDGRTPPSTGQGVVRWLSQFIPFFNLVDASVPYRDPLLRRFGDRWAGTRVIDSERALTKARGKVARRLLKKGFEPPREVGMTMEGFARLA